MFNKRHPDRWADKQAVRVINLHSDTLGLVFNHLWEEGREGGVGVRRVRRLQRHSVIVVYETLSVTTLDFPTSGLALKKKL